jgi:hypothetical protein
VRLWITSSLQKERLARFHKILYNIWLLLSEPSPDLNIIYASRPGPVQTSVCLGLGVVQVLMIAVM